jgi:mannan endo-1,4-beta-mannosidase
MQVKYRFKCRLKDRLSTRSKYRGKGGPTSGKRSDEGLDLTDLHFNFNQTDSESEGGLPICARDKRATQTWLLTSSKLHPIVASALFTAVVLSFSSICKAQTVEAETGTLSGTQVSTQHAGYSGTGYVTGFDATGDKLTVTVSVAKGLYNLYVGYAAPFGDKSNFVYLNGENIGSVAFPESMSFRETKVGKVYLPEGVNTIAIVKDWGYFEVDNLRLETTSPSSIGPVASALVTPSPDAKADSVYLLLSRLYGKVILSGQYGGATEFERIENIAGKTPVIRGFDLIDYSPSRVEHGATSTETEKAIEWNGQRGMTTFCWHWNAPNDLIDQPGKEWWRGFYTDATTFDVSKAMNDTTSEEYSLLLRDIDAIAIQLKKLQDAHVPVLWRPLHEAEGKWFWWGAKGPAPCKWLWKLLFDRLVNHHAIHNLIWIWTTSATPDALNWYPGDAYVDIVGADIYLPAGSYGSSFITFDNIGALYAGKKIVTLSENGPIPDPEKLFSEGAAWSWFATWSGGFITDGVSNSENHVAEVFNHDYVITLDEIDSIDSIVAMLQERKDDHEEVPVTGVDVGALEDLPFANPIQDGRLVLESAGQPFNAVIYDLQGRMIFPQASASENESMVFDFRQQPAGLYLLKVATRSSVKVYRVLR